MHVNIKEKFLEALVKYAREIQVGDPLNPKTKMGPLVSKEHYNKVKSFIDVAVKQGHQILCGETIE